MPSGEIWFGLTSDSYTCCSKASGVGMYQAQSLASSATTVWGKGERCLIRKPYSTNNSPGLVAIANGPRRAATTDVSHKSGSPATNARMGSKTSS